MSQRHYQEGGWRWQLGGFHRPHGQLTAWTTPLTPKGYEVRVSCPCGVTFARWVLRQDAEEALLRLGLMAFLN